MFAPPKCPDDGVPLRASKWNGGSPTKSSGSGSAPTKVKPLNFAKLMQQRKQATDSSEGTISESTPEVSLATVGASTRCDVDLNPESSAPPSGRPSWRSLDSSDTGFGAVGKVVEVYWEGESEWFRGRLTCYRDADGKHRVDYDDGESEWLVLAKNSVRFPEGDLVTFTSPVKKEIRRLRDNLNSSECRRDLQESRLKPQSAVTQSRSVAGESAHPHQDGKGVEDSPNQEGDNRQDLPPLSSRFWQGLQKSVAGVKEKLSVSEEAVKERFARLEDAKHAPLSARGRLQEWKQAASEKLAASNAGVKEKLSVSEEAVKERFARLEDAMHAPLSARGRLQEWKQAASERLAASNAGVMEKLSVTEEAVKEWKQAASEKLAARLEVRPNGDFEAASYDLLQVLLDVDNGSSSNDNKHGSPPAAVESTVDVSSLRCDGDLVFDPMRFGIH